ncbi:cytoglobin-1 [Brachyhypopomus gauderio]|uniref:cytoglobin-1 n=1 Tax=Brachyhypopomus gauderio TaxID=698409 RepID=UPI004040F71C
MEGIREGEEQRGGQETLTEAERSKIQHTWAKVCEKKEDAGVAVLIRLFTSVPRARQYFSQFRHMEDPDTMRASVQLRKHAMRVMNTLSTLVENTHDAQQTASVLQAVARSHALRHGVEPLYFKILAGVIQEVLVEAFPEAFDAEAQGAWSKLMGVIYTHVTRVYTEIGWSSSNSTAE